MEFITNYLIIYSNISVCKIKNPLIKTVVLKFILVLNVKACATPLIICLFKIYGWFVSII